MTITAKPAAAPPPAPGEAKRGVSAPPVAAKPKTSPSSESAVRKTPNASIREIERWFLKTYMMAGTALGLFKPALAEQIIASAPKCAKAMAELCEKDAKFRKMISGMMVAGVYSAVIAAHIPILLVIAAEYLPNDPDKRINQDMALGFARLLSDDGIAGMMFGDSESDDGTPE